MASNLPVKRSKRSIAEHVKNMSLSFGNTNVIDDLLNIHLDPSKPIQDEDNIDWCKHLIAGGNNNFKEFSNLGKKCLSIFCRTHLGTSVCYYVEWSVDACLIVLKLDLNS